MKQTNISVRCHCSYDVVSTSGVMGGVPVPVNSSLFVTI